MMIIKKWFQTGLVAGWFLGVPLASGQTEPVPDTPLRTDPVERIISDLEQYIPEQMEKDRIPGISVALIHEGKIAWNRGFGITNDLFPRPVTTQTVFSAASLGKPITAWVALKMVEEGKIDLDSPLRSLSGDPGCLVHRITI